MAISSLFRIKVYSNPVRDNKLVADWTPYVEALNWSTNAFGGFGQCTFSLKRPLKYFLSILYGWGQPTFVTNRIRITDPFGEIVYEGMIYALSARVGTEIVSRSAHSLFNCVSVDYTITQGRRVPVQRSQWADDAVSRAAFGKKVQRLELPGSYTSVSPTPQAVATRFINQHRMPATPDAKVKGGESAELRMEVSCVGLVTPALEWRYAFGTRATGVDTAQIVKDILGANPVPEGSAGAGVGPSGSGWYERLNYARSLGYGQEFISTNFAGILNSGTVAERNLGSGSQRIEIVRLAAQQGSVNQRRMLFQVWADRTANASKGIAHFKEMSETRPQTPGYTGYYDRAFYPIVWNAGQTRIPLWRLRAGRWITTFGIAPQSLYPTIYDDPRCFWIEETNYDVDTATLTLSPNDEFNAEQYLGRLIGGKKVITGYL